jgi:hypothetical protein
MKKYLILIFIFASCNKPPQITYIDNVITKYDTITDYSFGGVDTIYSTTPCDSFTALVRKNDTIYFREVKEVIQTKYITKDSIVFRTPIIQQNIIKNKGQIGSDNINSKTKKGDNITGDGNTVTKPTNKKDRFWLGVLCATGFWYVLGFGLSVLERYVPISAFVVGIIRRFLPNGQ